MIAVHARYRGREKARALVVERSATALSTLPGVGTFDIVGVEDIRANVEGAEHALNLIMALLSDGNWAIGLGIAHRNALDQDAALRAATRAVGTKSATVGVRVDKAELNKVEHNTDASDIAAAFVLIGHVLAKRTLEGREATALVRGGLNQNEAAEELGISKQAMSQRLSAAGWQAEQCGWKLALNLITRAAA